MPGQQQSLEADPGLFSLRHLSPSVSPRIGGTGAWKLLAGGFGVPGEMTRAPACPGPVSHGVGGCRDVGGSTRDTPAGWCGGLCVCVPAEGQK